MQLSNIWELRKKFVDTSTTGLFKLKNMRICWGIYSIKMYVWTVFLDLEIWLFGSKIKVINVACSRHAFLLFRNLLRCCVFIYYEISPKFTIDRKHLPGSRYPFNDPMQSYPKPCNIHNYNNKIYSCTKMCPKINLIAQTIDCMETFFSRFMTFVFYIISSNYEIG